MLEFYLKLYNAKSTSYGSRSSSHSVGREEVLGAASISAHLHPLGHAMFMAENGDHSFCEKLEEWVGSILPALATEVVMVAIGRPLPNRMQNLIRQSPRYDRAQRKCKIIKADAAHLRELGKDKEADKLNHAAHTVMQCAIHRVQQDILETGKCPRCHGTGIAERKGTACHVCLGSGKTIPDLAFVKSKLPAEAYHQFVHLVELLQSEQGEWVRGFLIQMRMEKAE